jgi:hypothetical protein
LFEANEITRHAMARNLTELLDQYDLRKKIITYVKDESANLACKFAIFLFFDFLFVE